MHTHGRTHAQTYGKKRPGDIFTREMSPAVGAAPLLKWHLHTFTLNTGVLPAHRPRKFMGLKATMRRVEGAAEPLVEVRAIHSILRNVGADGWVGWGAGGLVFPLMLIWQKTD